MKKMLVTMLCATMVFGLCACGSSSGGESTSGGESAAEESNSDSEDGYKIGFTDNYNGNSYHQSMEKYMQDRVVS